MAEVEDRIYSAFASIASSLGYSDVHGRIISALLVSERPMSPQELSKKTKYSDSAISLSLDLLELVGLIKKRKNMGDRQLYITLEGDLLEGLRRALTLKIQKEIITTLAEFETYKSKKNERIISIFEKEIKRLQDYVNRLAGVEIPKKR